MARYSDVKIKLKINIDKHLNDGFATVTHLWQNPNNGVSKLYKKPATAYLQNEFQLSAEEAEQLYMHLKFDVPFPPKATPKKPKIIYGVASYYAEKFNGRQTANGEIYDGKKLTAACNQLPLGTWIRVTNLNNNRSVIVKTNDRLHIRMKRVVDLSRAAAEKLGYISRGLTKVRVELLEKK